MDRIELAVLPDSSSLADAMALMRSRGQSGVLSLGTNGTFRVVTARDVVLASHAQAKSLAEVVSPHTVSYDFLPPRTRNSGPPAPPKSAGGGWGSAGLTEVHEAAEPETSVLEQYFEGGSHDFAILSVGATAVIATRSERLAQLLRMSVSGYVCTCSKDLHEFDLKPPICELHGCPVASTSLG